VSRFPEDSCYLVSDFDTTLALAAQVRDHTLQLRVLLFQLLQPLRLVHLQPAVFPAPTEVRLLRNPGLLTCQSRRLPVRYGHLDLPQQI
jgi:hypothetical protein